MDVDIDGGRVDFQKEHDCRMTIEIERLRCAIRGMRENAIAHQPSVHEEVLIAAAAEAEAAADVARGARAVVRLVDLRQVLVGFAAEDLDCAVAQGGGRRQVEHQAAVVRQAKRARRQRQRIRRNNGDDRTKFGIGTA